MLLFPNTRIELSTERPLLPGVIVDTEGSPMVAGYAAGAFGVQESTGGAGDKFVGVAISRPLSPSVMPTIETLTVPVGLIVPLRSIPVNGTVRVTKAGVTQVVAAGAPAAANEVQFVNGSQQLVFFAGQAAQVVSVTYVRQLTVAQAIMVQGNQDIGGPAGAYFGQVGLITRGDVFTTEFDTLVDWSAPTDLRLAANGKFTLGGTGALVPGYVISAPSDGNVWLGLHINAD